MGDRQEDEGRTGSGGGERKAPGRGSFKGKAGGERGGEI